MQKKPIILIADPENLRLYRSVLGDEELIEEYHNLEDLDQINDGDADLVILDSGFSPENGLHFLKEVKTRKPHAPVIFLTDVSSESIVIRAFRLGAVEYYRKPVSLFSLKETVMNLLAVKRTERDRRKRARRPVQDENDHALTTEMPSGIFHVVCHIDSNLTTPLTLDELAYMANLSKFHFCRTFKKHTGLTPKKFISLRRVERAKILLSRNTDMNVSMIAYEVGFCDVNSFIKTFRKITGSTPHSYKKSLQEPVASGYRAKVSHV